MPSPLISRPWGRGEQRLQPDRRPEGGVRSWNPVDLLKHPNKFTWIALGVLLALILIVVLVVRLVVRRLGRPGRTEERQGVLPISGEIGMDKGWRP